MKIDGYNIYYEQNKINKSLLSKNDVDNVMNRKSIFKKSKYSDKYEEIKTSDINIVGCIVI